MELSVIIPSRSEPLLGEVVARALASAGPSAGVEVIVVASGPLDALPHDSRVSVIDVAPEVWEASRYNRGLWRSSGDLVVFLDGDCLPTPDWFAGIIASQRRGPYICCGAVESAPGEFWEACYNVVCFREFLTGRPPESRRFLASYCLWGPRDAFAGVGGFDESLRFAEDLDLTVRLARAGWRLRFEPTVVVVHRKAGQTVGRLIHRGWMHGGTSLRARLLYPDAFGVAPRLMSPPFLVIGAPLISLYFLAKTFRDSPEHRSLIVRAAPAMYLHRVAWCLGAARTRLTGASANDRPSEAGRYSDRDQVNGNPAIPRSKGDDRSALDSASCDSGPHSG